MYAIDVCLHGRTHCILSNLQEMVDMACRHTLSTQNSASPKYQVRQCPKINLFFVCLPWGTLPYISICRVFTLLPDHLRPVERTLPQRLISTKLYDTVLNCTTIYSTVLHCTKLYYTVLHFISVLYMFLHFTLIFWCVMFVNICWSSCCMKTIFGF